MSKPIFNSLGSNYSWQFAWLALRQQLHSSQSAVTRLHQQLADRYEGQTFLLYKGRDAIEFGLRVLGVGAGDEVLTQAFTCHAIEEAIERTGASPIFIDLGEGQLNPTLETLDYAFKKAKHPKALLIQHTLGHTANIKKIRQWCDERSLFLFEDLAQALGSRDANEDEVGKYADVVIHSFGRDKIIDTVAGGATIFKNKLLEWKPEIRAQAEALYQDQVQKKIAPAIIRRDLSYPFLTHVIRSTHQIGFGKVLFKIGRRLGWLTSPIESPTVQMSTFPPQYAALALKQLLTLEAQLHHRREMAQLYQQELANDVKIQLFSTAETINHSSNLRFCIGVANPDQVSQLLAKRGIYITDRWYRQAVDCGSLERTSQYQAGSCPNAEKLAAVILNLPTHWGVQAPEVKRICQNIKKVVYA
jgi:dTDP-4-amino-4,6-dideoxygalactose transaminase